MREGEEGEEREDWCGSDEGEGERERERERERREKREERRERAVVWITISCGVGCHEAVACTHLTQPTIYAE